MKGALLTQRVNSFIGCTFLATVALYAGLAVWQASFNENPLANAMATVLIAQEQLQN